MKALNEFKKAMKSQFEFVAPRFENYQGKIVIKRDSSDKIVRMIPTGVQLSPMDATSVKEEKIAEKFEQIKKFVSDLGGMPAGETYNTAIFEFDVSKTKGFSVHIWKTKIRSSMLLDENYQDVYFEIYYTTHSD